MVLHHIPARLENALRNESIAVKIAANGRDWKRNSPTYIFSIMRKAITSRPKLFIFNYHISRSVTNIIQVFSLFLSFSLKLLDKKVVITFHDIVQKSNLKDNFLKNHTRSGFLSLKRLALEYYTRINCSIADKVIVHSQIAQNVLTQDYPVPQKKIQVIPHGIDQVTFSANEKRI